MRLSRSLTFKLILAFIAVSLVGAVLVALLASRTTANEFGTYLVTQAQEELAARLRDYYRFNGSWEGVEQVVFASGGGEGAGMGRGRGQGRGQGSGPAGSGAASSGAANGGISPGGGGAGTGLALATPTGEIIVPGAGFPPGSEVPAESLAEGLPIEVEGETVGVLLGRHNLEAMVTPPGQGFLAQVTRNLTIATIGAMGVALLLAVLLARTLTRPLRELTAATRLLAGGALGHQVEVNSEDELGELARSFNQMSRDLAYAQERRQQMTADIAHDLRTPISVIQGHAEALRDGVLPPTPETFDLIHDEALRLNRLVEDLRTLSQAEAGELELLLRPVALAPFLKGIVTAQTPRAGEAGVTLELAAAEALPPALMDPDRMARVLNNLVDNALRHTPAGGEVCLEAEGADEKVLLRVRDSGPGIAAADLPHLFERFYRGDKSRRRHAGGSGLGLAIARSIVEAHGGRIWVESELGRGATFNVELPAATAAG